MPACPRPGAYVPRQTHDCDAAVLARRHLPGFLARLEEGGHWLPEFVQRELEEFAGCGDFERGFVQTVCRQCGDELRVPFSCKGRGLPKPPRALRHPPPPASAPTPASPPTSAPFEPAVAVAPQPEAQPDVDPPASPPRPAVALTERVVAARLATRAARIKAECAVPWLVLDLAIERGLATLATINGMPFTEADPIHTCVRTQIRGLRFPLADTRAKFSLTIDLSKDPR